jgi:hypothetical protein
MPPTWKRVAVRGDKSAYAIEEIGAALVPALDQDARGALAPNFLDGLRAICADQERSLFRDDIEPQLEALRSLTGAGLGRVVLDEAVRLSAGGEEGLNIAVKAVESALTDRAARGARQVEEHYFRKSTAPRANNVRDRIEEAIGVSRDGIAGLARRLLGIDMDRPTRRPLRQQGLDDGVRL